MNPASLLLLLDTISKLMEFAGQIKNSLGSEDPTPEEFAALDAKTAEIEARWASLAPRKVQP